MAVNSHHGLEVGFASDVCAAADESAQRTFLDIARERLALSHGAASRCGRGFGCRFYLSRRLIRVRFGSGVIRNFRFVGGVVRIFLILGILSYPKHLLPP